WVVGKEEDETSWLKLLRKLSKQEVCYRNGLRLFIHDGSGGLEKAFEQITFGPVERQRCIFHKMRNVVNAVQGDPEMFPGQKRERRKALLADLVTVWEAESREEAQTRCEQFAAKWEEREPEAVGKLRNGFAATTAYYVVEAAARAQGQDWQRRYLRTTSLHERWNRTLRRKSRAAVVFQSERGLLANAYLTLGCQGKATEGQLGEWLSPLRGAVRMASP
ncbi:MAG TPA: transposase, partial [Armatimonadota bacterium]|nr:transposase [Armatimonadota bacterium]